MKTMKYIVLTLAIFSLILIPGFAGHPIYSISFYNISPFIYPGSNITLQVTLNYNNVKRKQNVPEKVILKIYKQKTDNNYNSETPLNEISENINLSKYGGQWYGNKEVTIKAPDAPGQYYLLATTENSKYGTSITISKTAMSIKSTKNQLLILVHDRKTGDPFENVEVKLSGPQESKTYRTDKNGLIAIYTQDIKDKYATEVPVQIIDYYGYDDMGIKYNRNNVAVSSSIVSNPATEKQYKFHAVNGVDVIDLSVKIPEEKEIFKGYIYTDRPIYRPEQMVHFKGIFRTDKNDNLLYLKNKEVEVIIKDPKGNEIYKNKVKTDEYGAISDYCKLRKEPPLGAYNISCIYDGQTAGGTFQVEEYRKPEFEVKINTDKDYYIEGDTINFNVRANYYFGGPVAEKEFTYEIYRNYYYPYYWYYWWEEECDPYKYGYNAGSEYIASNKGKTDKNGMAVVNVTSGKINYDSTYLIKIRMTDESRREVTGSANVKVTKGAFYLTIKTDKYYYSPGDKLKIKVQARDYNNKPVSTPLTLKLRYERYDEKEKNWKWDEKKFELTTDETGVVLYNHTIKEKGYYDISAEAIDQNKNTIKTVEYALYCYCDDGWYDWYRFNDVEIIPDKNYYDVGDTANFLIISPFNTNKGLITVEKNDIINNEIIDLSKKTANYSVKITEKDTPNFNITVSFFSNGKLYNKSKNIICPSKEKFLTVSVEPDKKKYEPRDEAKFIIKTLDKDNRPVSSQVCLGIADESVYAIMPDGTPNIQKFFHGSKEFTTYTYGSDGSTYGLPVPPRSYYYDCCESQCKTTGEVSVENLERSLNTVMPGSNKPQELAKPEFTREYFPDTAYFNPSIITDANGMAEVNFLIPDSLTTWRSTARAVTQDTKVGETTDKIIVSKDLLVRLIMPRFFTERDECVITGIVHNYLNSEKTVYVKLETEEGMEIKDSPQYKIHVKANGTEKIDWNVKIKKAGDYKVKLTALSDEVSDAVQMNIPVLPHGTEKYYSISGLTQNMAEHEITVPDTASQTSSKCLIYLEPSIASTMLSVLPYLMNYPYGCVEQTMSSFLPTVMAARTIEELEMNDPNMYKELPKMVKEGINRLYSFQHGDGGWGWWENDQSHPYMTAYVIYGLTIAKEAGYDIDKSRIEKGIAWMKNHYTEEKDLNAKAYMTFSATKAGADWKEALMELYKYRTNLCDYSKAVLAISLYKMGFGNEAKELLKLLKENGSMTGTDIYWGEKKNSYDWMDGKVETTAYCLRAFLMIEPDSKLIPGIIYYLLHTRQGNYWYSTKDTAAAVMAIADYLEISKEKEADFTADVYFNGTKIKSVKFTKENVSRKGEKIQIPFDQGLMKGSNKIRFEVKGKGSLYYAIYLKYYTDEENVKKAGAGFNIKRTYYLIKPEEMDFKKRKTFLGKDGHITVNSQDIIQVELSVTGNDYYQYFLLEDPKPGGCEIDKDEKRGHDNSYGYWNYWYAHCEVKDEKTAYFATYTTKGTQTITYRLRAETPGTYHVMPATGSLMYSPEIGGNSDEIILTVKENNKEIKSQTTPVSAGEIENLLKKHEERKTPGKPEGTIFIIAIAVIIIAVTVKFLRK